MTRPKEWVKEVDQNGITRFQITKGLCFGAAYVFLDWEPTDKEYFKVKKRLQDLEQEVIKMRQNRFDKFKLIKTEEHQALKRKREEEDEWIQSVKQEIDETKEEK
jgi:hypothetical protein